MRGVIGWGVTPKSEVKLWFEKCHIKVDANCSFLLPDFDSNDDVDEEQMVEVLVMHDKQHSMGAR